MAIFNTPLGMNVKNNPIKESPFVMNAQIGDAFPPFDELFITTENDIAITTENGRELTTG